MKISYALSRIAGLDKEDFLDLIPWTFLKHGLEDGSQEISKELD